MSTTAQRQRQRRPDPRSGSNRPSDRPYPPENRRKPPKKRRKKRRSFPYIPVIALLLVAVIVGFALNLSTLFQMAKLRGDNVPGWVDVQILAETSGGRRMVDLEGVEDIAIHYVGNPGATAQQNHDYFDQPGTEVSSHFVVGLDGEVIQCLPLHERSSATNDRNIDTISIEVCHPDATGQFTPATYDSLVKLTAWLCDHCGLSREDVIRHYDVTGKACPLYFVENPDAWTQFLADVKAY